MPVTRIVLGPGASGSVERLVPHRDGLERRGLRVDLVALPKGQAGRAVRVYAEALAHIAEPVVIGGHSFGGRVASLVAADTPPAALVVFSYPLHAPGRHDTWDERTAHWTAIRCPVLLLSGEADPFARLDLLRRAAERLPDGKLVTYPGLGHGLLPVLDAALDETAAFIRERT